MIESSLFRGCKWLTEIVIPPQLLEIKEGAFENCSSLISVELPNSIEKLGDEYGPVAYGSGGVFQNCTLLQEVNIPKNLQFLGAYTFLDVRPLIIFVFQKILQRQDIMEIFCRM